MRSSQLAARLAGAVIVALAAASTAAPTVSVREVGSGFSFPVEAAHARDGSGRLYVVEQGGLVRILQDGAILPTPFADLSGVIATDGGEQGLLGLAFHPSYATNGAFYVFYTRTDWALVVARMLRHPANPDIADPASRIELLAIEHPTFTNHNGGKIAFGRDGHLYIAAGDGGGSGDPFRTAQDTAQGRGKILRIAVDGGTGYSIPPGNPFSSCSPLERCREVFHYGLRNPWRFSFDRATGDLWIGDVGQNAWEEIDFVPAGGTTRNFGWGIYEADACFNDTYFGAAGACSAFAGHARPVLSYPHALGISVTGGFRYRGRRSPAMRGFYFYADYGSERIWAAEPSGGGWASTEVLRPSMQVAGISSFAEDEFGELYLVDHQNGKLWAIEASGPPVPVAQDMNGDAKSDLLYRNDASGAVFRLLMDGTGSVRGSSVYAEPDLDWLIVADADFDADGRNDLLWRHAGDGRVYLMTFDRRGFPAGGAFIHTEPDPAWRIVQTPDLDGDGRADIVWWNASSGRVYVMRMDGSRIAAQGFIYREPDTGWRIVGSADAGTGRHDRLLWHHRTTGRVYEMAVNGFAVSGAFIHHEPDTAWKLLGAADFNGDGKSDLLWRHVLDGRVYVSLREGGANHVYQEPDTGWKIEAFGDYDGDGKADLLWRNEGIGEVFILLMDALAVRGGARAYLEPDPSWGILGPRAYGRLSGSQDP